MVLSGVKKSIHLPKLPPSRLHIRFSKSTSSSYVRELMLWLAWFCIVPFAHTIAGNYVFNIKRVSYKLGLLLNNNFLLR